MGAAETPTPEEDKVWLITGCSSGMGREFARAALTAGYRVVTTARNPSTLDEFIAEFPEQARAIELDVTQHEQVSAAFETTLEEFGRLDVLVNNAGYSYLSSIEEGDEAEVRALFETNFFGLLAMTRAVIPHMRERRSGQIIFNSSQAGLMSRPGTGYYSTTKYAVEALSEALVFELAPFNIKVTALEPGPFRTDWAGRSMRSSTSTIDDYTDTVHARIAFARNMGGAEAGDPKRAARTVVDLVRSEAPPPKLLLGQLVLDHYREKLQSIQSMLEEWESVTLSADFPAE
ncbi:MAG: short-chain dehydrogenase/reductase [Deltaproteobacteria bacterium]|nr:short-chain dehydrogenase/reductase [Deltaproteobacteria bacterium]